MEVRKFFARVKHKCDDCLQEERIEITKLLNQFCGKTFSENWIKRHSCIANPPSKNKTLNYGPLFSGKTYFVNKNLEEN